jgi:hypothetical protein
MVCPSCRSAKQAELTAEMLIHFPGLILENPGVWLFPKLLVCLDCGSSRFSVPENELALIASGAAKTERSNGQQGANEVAPRNTMEPAGGAMRF